MSTPSGGSSATILPSVEGLPDLSAPPSPPRGPRLTRRGRLVLVSALATALTAGFALTVVLTMALGTSAAGASTESDELDTSSSTIVVEDGDTLWEIAQRIRPNHDPRSTVYELVEINDLSDTRIDPGQVLLLPSS
ncbi:LysM peptidoglycan-binding domain-containing protein [Salinactinospora qingdaonensis]|uniref:LysM peptidoglycan-binding domain-containing protein n=1 Tax=Salinactinospora qingdaonensis TaxID=702744 RepID=UPI0031EC9C89